MGGGKIYRPCEKGTLNGVICAIHAKEGAAARNSVGKGEKKKGKKKKGTWVMKEGLSLFLEITNAAQKGGKKKKEADGSLYISLVWPERGKSRRVSPQYYWEKRKRPFNLNQSRVGGKQGIGVWRTGGGGGLLGLFLYPAKKKASLKKRERKRKKRIESVLTKKR